MGHDGFRILAQLIQHLTALIGTYWANEILVRDVTEKFRTLEAAAATV